MFFSLNPQAEVLLEKVARALCELAGDSPDLGLHSNLGDPIDYNDANGEPKYYYWRRYSDRADIAIAATIQALIELELPDAALIAAQHSWRDKCEWRKAITFEFRAILTTLLPLLTKGEK